MLVYTCTGGLISVHKRNAASVSDQLIEKVASVVAYLFGSAQLQEDTHTLTFTPVLGSGSHSWQSARASELVSKLNVFGSQAPMDSNATDSITTADGWVYDFVGRRWSRNRLADRRLRVIGRKRCDLEELHDDHITAIEAMWEAIKRFEVMGGKSPQHEESAEATAVMQAFEALLSRSDCCFFKAVFEIASDDLHLATYLVKQAARALCGLSAVELLVIHGEKRSGKDTYVF